MWAGAVYSGRMAYGKFWHKDFNESIPAHRAAWLIYRGEIPHGLKVLHRCDVPGCVNPEHLFLGTPRENTLDMIAKGRHMPMVRSRQGTNSNFAKLSPELVMAIREATGRQRDIADRFAISQASVSLIKRRINWKHL